MSVAFRCIGQWRLISQLGLPKGSDASPGVRVMAACTSTLWVPTAPSPSSWMANVIFVSCIGIPRLCDILVKPSQLVQKASAQDAGTSTDSRAPESVALIFRVLIGTQIEQLLSTSVVTSEYMLTVAMHAACLLRASLTHITSCKLHAKARAYCYIRTLCQRRTLESESLVRQSAPACNLLLPKVQASARQVLLTKLALQLIPYALSTVQYLCCMPWLAGSSQVPFHQFSL